MSRATSGARRLPDEDMPPAEARFTLPGDDRPLAGPVAAVIAALEADIIAGRILPRNRLIEDHLMEDYGAKRHVVRAALEELERLGVVVKPRYRGAELRRFDRGEIARLYDMREVLHRAAVERIAVPSAEALKPVLHWLTTHAEAAGGQDLVAIHRTNMMFHDAFFALCDNPFLVTSIRQHDWLSFPIRAYGVADASALAQACAEHRTLVDLLMAGRMDELQALTISHMSRARSLYEQKFLAGR
ncbi:GntR family transcriptional regulator [Xanthobacter tagetidis]|uniref:GntR family transcriptional regulator n=1 Tax=Xanthobacter tagetidis TaxID=60216 RepID=A0A3L7AM46_9HYPH|nr:GntR family transcriptional regulator [Xanthobacter tagetidis]MBB6309008.1 DNA-binding GntR family transcriptional regulator [Xanthobacter tagetidis]RLP80492.1 GntR family transcriptional regulator [Xanthobacter tagetidis]